MPHMLGYGCGFHNRKRPIKHFFAIVHGKFSLFYTLAARNPGKFPRKKEKMLGIHQVLGNVRDFRGSFPFLAGSNEAREENEERSCMEISSYFPRKGRGGKPTLSYGLKQLISSKAVRSVNQYDADGNWTIY